MLLENRDLMTNARQALNGRWGDAIAAFVVYAAISFVLNAIPMIGFIASIIVMGPLSLGLYLFYLPFTKGGLPRIAILFDGFKNFLNTFIAYLLVLIFVLLWALLLIVPGIIAAISYSMTFLIMAENPTMDGLEAIKKSKELMYGYKWKYFCLGLRFIGWGLLIIVTFGIAALWVGPYWITSKVLFYEDIKKEKTAMISPPAASPSQNGSPMPPPVMPGTTS